MLALNAEIGTFGEEHKSGAELLRLLHFEGKEEIGTYADSGGYFDVFKKADLLKVLLIVY